MIESEEILALDVGEARIGVARANTIARIAEPLETIAVDGHEIARLSELISQNRVKRIIVGLPRNQSGEETAQSVKVRDFSNLVKSLGVEIHFQDESVTSVKAEDELQQRDARYTKEDIDALAACYILEDYLRDNA